MTLTSDSATKRLYEKYISIINRLTTKTMGGFSPVHPLNHQQTGLKQQKVVVGCQKWWKIIIANMKQKWWFKRMLANLFRTSLFHRYWWKQMADIEATLRPARKDDGKTSAQHINHSPRSAQWFSAHSMPAFGSNFEDQKQSCARISSHYDLSHVHVVFTQSVQPTSPMCSNQYRLVGFSSFNICCVSSHSCRETLVYYNMTCVIFNLTSTS